MIYGRKKARELNSGGIIDGGCQHDKKSAVRTILVHAVIHLSLCYIRLGVYFLEAIFIQCNNAGIDSHRLWW